MFRLIVLSLFLCCISAHFYPNYEYGNGYNKFYTGIKKGGIDSYHSGGYQPNHYEHKSWNNKWPNNHGYGYNYKSYHYNPYPIVKRLPPIYKTVKQPVLIEQPVIIRKIPVFKKTKEVTVKKLPPIIEKNVPSVVEKDAGHGYVPDIIMRKPEVDGKPMIPEYDGKPLYEGTHKHEVVHEYPEDRPLVMMRDKIPMEMVPGVDYMGEDAAEKAREIPGLHTKKAKDEMKGIIDVMPMEMMMRMVNMKPIEEESDSYGDFDQSVFDSSEKLTLDEN